MGNTISTRTPPADYIFTLGTDPERTDEKTSSSINPFNNMRSGHFPPLTINCTPNIQVQQGSSSFKRNALIFLAGAIVWGITRQYGAWATSKVGHMILNQMKSSVTQSAQSVINTFPSLNLSDMFNSGNLSDLFNSGKNATLETVKMASTYFSETSFLDLKNSAVNRITPLISSLGQSF